MPQNPATRNAPIFINGRFLAREVTGVDRFAREVMVALDALLRSRDGPGGQHRWTVAVPPSARDLPELQAMEYVTTGTDAGTRWEQWALPRLLRGARCLSLCNTAPLLARGQAVVIHDASPVRVPAAYSRAFRTWYRWLIPQMARHATHLFTVSEFSRREIAAGYGIPIERIRTLPRQGIEHMQRIVPDEGALDRHDLRRRPYVLAVSSRAPHKNFALLVDAVMRIGNPDFDVVVAGGTNPRIFGAAGSNLPSWVKHVGYVSDGELKALYQHAACFVFPSLYEGYGMPPLEAMACGAPVLMARAASMPEVYGDAADWFDPRDAEQLARLIVDTLASPARREVLKARGHALVAASSWRSTAAFMLDSLFAQ